MLFPPSWDRSFDHKLVITYDFVRFSARYNAKKAFTVGGIVVSWSLLDYDTVSLEYYYLQR